MNDNANDTHGGLLGKVQDMMGKAVGMTSASTLGSHSAQAFAQNAMSSNLFEIEAAKIAQSRGQNPAVRDFAQTMLNDHQMLASRLEPVLDEMGGEKPQAKLDQRRQGMIDNLRDAPAGAFDQTFLDQQLGAHREAIQLFQGYAEKGDNPLLKSAAQAALPILQQHLNHVTQLRGH